MAMEKLNQQLQLQKQYEAKLNQLEAEKRSLAEQRQQMEQLLAQVQSSGEKPAEQPAALVLERLPEVSNVGIDCHNNEEDGDSTNLNGNSVK